MEAKQKESKKLLNQEKMDSTREREAREFRIQQQTGQSSRGL
jgi:hypothetical protein